MVVVQFVQFLRFIQIVASVAVVAFVQFVASVVCVAVDGLLSCWVVELLGYWIVGLSCCTY